MGDTQETRGWREGDVGIGRRTDAGGVRLSGSGSELWGRHLSVWGSLGSYGLHLIILGENARLGALSLSLPLTSIATDVCSLIRSAREVQLCDCIRSMVPLVVLSFVPSQVAV